MKPDLYVPLRINLANCTEALVERLRDLVKGDDATRDRAFEYARCIIDNVYTLALAADDLENLEET